LHTEKALALTRYAIWLLRFLRRLVIVAGWLDNCDGRRVQYGIESEESNSIEVSLARLLLVEGEGENMHPFVHLLG
jgi:hypothetical protein